MCGRCAISRRGVREAEDLLGCSAGRSAGDDNEPWGNSFDNPNMSPGMRGLVFRKRPADAKNQSPGVVCTDMVWGLVTRGGTKTSPLPTGPTQHFSNLMFNARSDTLYDKRSFRDLALKGNTCVMAVDGFYEWKAPDRDTLGGGSGKQPYYVHRSDGLPLLLAGLWTAVPTGRECGYNGKPEMLHTFTLLTTDACPKLQWMHNRTPVFLWDPALALEWIHSPSQSLEKRISSIASSSHKSLAWHPVTKRMSKAQYRGDDCTKAIRIDKVPSVKSFFAQSYAVKKDVESKSTVLDETGPTHALSEGWRDAAKLEMERKRPAPFSPATLPVQKAKKSTQSSSPAKSPAGSRTGKQPSPARRGQITSFFGAKGSKDRKV